MPNGRLQHILVWSSKFVFITFVTHGTLDTFVNIINNATKDIPTDKIIFIIFVVDYI